MGGGCELLFCAAHEEEARRAAETAVGEVRRIEHKYSRYRTDSVVSQVNQAAGTGTWTECDEETIWLFNYAGILYTNSGGLFDITSGVLRRAWNFDAGIVPDAETLAPLLALIGWQRVERHEKNVRLPEPGMEVDFGGFGKEYAADSAASLVAKLGMAHGYVNLGGDIRVIGSQPDGQPWLIAIQDPRQRGKIVATIPVQAGGLATSGDYEKFFEKDGRRYCHVLDPRNGMPVAYWRSVSIVAPLAIVAGSYSTIAMLQEDAGIDWLKRSGFPYLALANDGELYQST
ncbi:MAG: FAD:protein FMN transferase [Thiobacillus sp.]|nr:FAD:protein FMN transferase [Thiobacillus sp.]